MKLQHYSLETPIDFDQSSIWTISCENPDLFETLTGDCYNQTKGGIGKWILWNDRVVDVAKNVQYIVDYHSVSFSDKKATNMLLEHIRNLAYDECHTVETHELLMAISKYLIQLSVDVDYPITFDDVELMQLLKATSISFLDESQNLCEKLMDYTVLLSRLSGTKVVVFVNLRCYLSQEKIVLLFRHCMTCGINVLCLEWRCGKCLENEKMLVVDADLCEFFQSSVN